MQIDRSTVRLVAKLEKDLHDLAISAFETPLSSHERYLQQVGAYHQLKSDIAAIKSAYNSDDDEEDEPGVLNG